MAYQQYQTLCQPNAWTAICELRPTRKSLFVQCPQVATTKTNSTVAGAPFAQSSLVAANDLRKTLVIGATGGNIVLNTDAVAYLAGTGVNIGVSTVGLPSSLLVASGDSSWGAWCRSQWFGYVNGAAGVNIEIWEEIYQCAAIILATTQAAAVAGGPLGTMPPGNWLSGNLAGGPANFRLSEPIDGETVAQQWFAWPVGSVAVSVTVSEAFDIVIPPDEVKKFSVQLPRLSPDAIDALNSLIAQMSQFDE